MTHPFLSLRDVSKSFHTGGREVRAVDGVSFDVEEGECLAIVGESGSGKSTVANMILGIYPQTLGEIAFKGSALPARRDLVHRRAIQLVQQNPLSSLNPRRSIGAIVAQPLSIHGIGSRSEREAQARKLLDVVGLPSRLFEAAPGQLSGGQRQRVVIARALALRPAILICDEPTSALDVSVQAQILNLLLDLRAEFGLTYIMVSHNLSVIEHMATDVAVMYHGRIVEHAPAARIFAAPAHPYTKVLLRSAMTIAPGAGIPDVGFDRSDPAFSEPVPPRSADPVAPQG